MKIKRFIARHTTAIVIILAFMIIASFVGCHIYVRQQLIKEYNSIIGKMYMIDPQAAERLADCLFSSDGSVADARKGQQALETWGYTMDGMDMAKTYDLYAYNIVYGIVAVFFIILIAVLIVRGRAYKEDIALERACIEEELLHAQQGELVYLRKQRMETQSYIENVAHQVRTPLANVMLNIGMVYDDLDESGQDMLDECNYHIERVNKLVDRLLKIGQLEAGETSFHWQKENLTNMIKSVAHRSCKGNPSDQHTHRRISLKLCDVSLIMDYEWMYEAVACLVENCLEHIGEDNKVYIVLSEVDDSIVINVEDDGSGFNEEDLSHIFERFNSGRNSKATKHYGIGLNLSKMVVEAHYGTIKAYNRKGGGAGFEIVIPRLKLKDKSSDSF